MSVNFPTWLVCSCPCGALQKESEGTVAIDYDTCCATDLALMLVPTVRSTWIPSPIRRSSTTTVTTALSQEWGLRAFRLAQQKRCILVI